MSESAVLRNLSVEAVTPDGHNANRGTPRGEYMLEQSLRRNGAGRSIVVDRERRVIAGNKTLEKAVELGIPLVEVETDGSALVVVRRTDLNLDDAGGRARELALADNRASEVSLDWDTLALEDYQASGVPTDLYWFDAEWEELLASDAGPFGDGAERPKDEPELPEETTVRACFELDAATWNRWTRYRDEWLAAGLADEGEVLKHLLSQEEDVP